VQINKAMVGFLTHSGYSHGGNGFESIAFLLDRFKGVDLTDPTDPAHGIDLKALAMKFAQTYKNEKTRSKEAGLGESSALPGIHHPVFKGKPVNYDPRERFIADFLVKHDDYNIFHAFYPRAGPGALRCGGVTLRLLRQCRRPNRGPVAGGGSGRTTGPAPSR